MLITFVQELIFCAVRQNLCTYAHSLAFKSLNIMINSTRGCVHTAVTMKREPRALVPSASPSRNTRMQRRTFSDAEDTRLSAHDIPSSKLHFEHHHPCNGAQSLKLD